MSFKEDIDDHVGTFAFILIIIFLSLILYVVYCNHLRII